MPIERNPFEKVYSALFDLIENHKPLAELIKVQNRISFVGGRQRDPMKSVISERDLPELRLMMVGATYETENTSCSSFITQQFQWGIATGDQRFDDVFQVNWELLRALLKWREKLFPLTWNDETFVLECYPIEHTVGLNETDLNRNIKGWSALWTGAVRMYFSTTDLAGDT